MSLSRMHNPDILGLVAGDGVYPEYVIDGARSLNPNIKIIGVGFKNETNPLVASLCDEYAEFAIGQLTKPFKFLQKYGVKDVMMAGGINPKNILTLRPDLRAVMALVRLPERNADSLLGAVVDEAIKDGFHILPASSFMEKHIPAPGLIAGPKPSANQEKDAEFGLSIAKQISEMHIGQSVVVGEGTVVAVEAIEGTSNCLKRAGELNYKQRPLTLAKVPRQEHDMRFDIPTVGATTFEICAASHVKQVVVEAHRCIILEREKVMELCKKYKITFRAI